MRWVVRVGAEQVGVEGDDERAEPHADEQIGEGLIAGARGAERAHGSSDEGDDERAPHVPLVAYLIVISVATHGDRDLVVDLFEVALLSGAAVTKVSMTG